MRPELNRDKTTDIVSADAVLDWIQRQKREHYEPGIERMTAMLEHLGHPERRLQFIHVAGTNGKGSTVSFLSYILREAGYDVGTYISPHVTTYRSRISYNHTPIDDAGLLHVYRRLYPVVEELAESSLGRPTEFEVLTAAAIVYFAEVTYPDIVIFETGLGGRLDSTNVVHPLISVITSIGYDHMRILGSDLASIAKEKAGIIKPGVPVVSARQAKEALHVLKETAQEKRASFYGMGEMFDAERLENAPYPWTFDFYWAHRRYSNVTPSLPGFHQIENASLAIMTVELLRLYYAFYIEPEHVHAGLKKAVHPGRMEVIAGEIPIVLDGAHNEPGMRSLVQSLPYLFPTSRIHGVLAIMKDKDIEHMLPHLLPHLASLTVTEAPLSRSLSAEQLFERIRHSAPSYPVYMEKEAHRALARALDLAKHTALQEAEHEAIKRPSSEKGREKTPRDVLLITGSLYLIEVLRPYVLKTVEAQTLLS